MPKISTIQQHGSEMKNKTGKLQINIWERCLREEVSIVLLMLLDGEAIMLHSNIASKILIRLAQSLMIIQIQVSLQL